MIYCIMPRERERESLFTLVYVSWEYVKIEPSVCMFLKRETIKYEKT